MRNLLETVIKAALIEAPVTRAKLRSMDAADLATARREGKAVFGYYAIVKGVSSEKALLNAVAGATMGSQDSETRVGVGATGPYANGNFIYLVQNDTDIARKNIVQVWIVPNILKDIKKTQPTDSDIKDIVKTQTEPDTTVSNVGLMIGRSPMMTATSYNKRVDNASKIDGTISSKAANTDAMQIKTTGMEKAVQAAQNVIGGNKDTQPSVVTPAETKPTDVVSQTQTITTNQMPSDVRAFQNWVINTKKDSAALGKFGADNKWGKLTKAAWIKYGAEYVKQFPDSAVDANQSQSNQGGGAGGGSGTGGGGTGGGGTGGGGTGLKKGSSLNWSASATTAKQIPYFFYDNATKKFKQQTGSITVAQAKPKYQITSTNKSYYLVEIDGKKVWVEKKYFK